PTSGQRHPIPESRFLSVSRDISCSSRRVYPNAALPDAFHIAACTCPAPRRRDAPCTFRAPLATTTLVSPTQSGRVRLRPVDTSSKGLPRQPLALRMAQCPPRSTPAALPFG